jgi:magnesium transporter
MLYLQEDNSIGKHIETAAHHLLRAVPRASAEDNVSYVFNKLRGHHYESAAAVYILNDNKQLLGLVPMAKLIAAQPEQQMSELMHRNVPAALLSDDQERVAALAVHHGLPAIPVIDNEGRFLGVVPPTSLIRILREEHLEDLHRLAGISDRAKLYSFAEASPVRRAKARLPWLIVGLLGSMVATLVMTYFEATLKARIAVAFFIPAIVYLADAIGTQTEAITVRGLSLSQLSFKQLFFGELKTGTLIGLILALISIPFVFLFFGDYWLAMAVGISLFAAGTIANCVGLLFPWLLSKMGKDPALGSGPVATIIQDVLSILIYFLIVTVILL